MAADPKPVEPSLIHSEPVARTSIIGLRTALYAMAAFTALCGYPAATWIPDLKYFTSSGSPPMDGMHQTALMVILAFGTTLPVYLLAAIHVGLTKRGNAYLKLSAIAFSFQVILGFAAQPLLSCIALLPVSIAGGSAFIQASKPHVQKRLANPASRKLILWPELVIIPIGVALVAIMFPQINDYYVPDEPNPPREFDSSEGWERLESAAEDTVRAFESVEGFGGFAEPDYSEHLWCDEGAAWDEEWVELWVTYDLGELEPDEERSLAYVESLLEYWPARGYEITLDYPREAAVGDGLQSYRLEAVRDDGVTVVYDVGYGSAELIVQSGCILKTSEVFPVQER